MKNQRNRSNDDNHDVSWAELAWIYSESWDSLKRDNGMPDMSQLGYLVRDSRTARRQSGRFGW
jgi:hypothetical protein